MAAGDSATSICNIALIALGEDPIKDLAENNKRAILCTARYNDLRRSMLFSHPWGFAKKQAQLAADVTAPLFTWQWRYRTPEDFIRFYNEPEQDLSIWEIMADDTGATFIYANDEPPFQCVYVYDCQDPTKFDPGFVQALAFQIASELALSLTQNSQRAQQGLQMMEGKLAMARFAGAQQMAPKEWDVDILLRSRR
jgi:hypothetical protein